MHDAILLTGLATTGRHGVFEHERREGQRFSADLVLHLDLAEAAGSDDLSDTIDYGAVADAVVAILGGPPFDLIEAVAGAIADRVLGGWPAVHAVEVTVHKPDAPIGHDIDDVAVRIRRGRD